MTNVVVGGGSGLGEAVAHALAPRGRLIVADVNGEHAARVAAEIGAGAEALECDLTDPQHVDALLTSIGDTFDAFVVTAALSGTMAAPRRIYEVNLIGLARLLDAVEPLAHPGSAAVVFSSSSAYGVPPVPAVEAVLADPLSPTFFDDLAAAGVDPDWPIAYPLTKKGVHLLMRRLAAPWGARGARILSLSPGTTDTPMARAEMARNPIMEQMIADRPIARMGRPEEIGTVVEFLTSDRASFMTGSDVRVDGGFTTVIPDTTGGRLVGLVGLVGR
jgi:NAD(P)-dependent dehydrogenase (short-subunit alcohol dehydrogenase family)